MVIDVDSFAVKADTVQVSHFSYCKNDSYVLYIEAAEGKKEIIETPSLPQTKCALFHHPGQRWHTQHVSHTNLKGISEGRIRWLTWNLI